MTVGRGGGRAARAVAPLPLRLILAVSTILAPSAAAEAGAQETIASDRPGIGSGSFVLPRGTIQLETGIEYARSGAVDSYSLGQALVRVGVPRVEMQVFANSLVVRRGGVGADPSSTGVQDVGLGVKAPLVRDAEAGFSLSIQGVVTAPTGSDALTADAWVGTVNALADVALGSRAGVGVNVGRAGIATDAANVTTVIVTPAVSLGGGFGAYAGWAGAFGADEDTHVAEGGVTYLPSADLQLDLNGGWDAERDDWFVGFGIARRWAGS